MNKYPITLPDVFIDVLSDTPCAGAVHSVLANFSEFIARNEMVFFRNYTDHGPRHVEGVLETACALISGASWDLVTPEDIALLTIAVVIHDVALHLQEPSFLALVSEESASVLLPDLDTDSWRDLWTGFVAEMSRLSQSQLNENFGVSEPIPTPDLDDPNAWTPLQYAYIGEFIRRHHHRLAHEIACFGLPGDAESISLSGQNEFLGGFDDLAGLVARSHGMAVRPLFSYLNTRYHLRTFNRSHPVYLMVLLRIADYLQLQSGRAPGSVKRVKRIKQPRSLREWEVHESIRAILYDQNTDPESVEVLVDPSRTSIDTFLRVQTWLSGIQRELDTSWAILGEVYGRYSEADLGITIRRIRSNLDNTIAFGKAAGFVPKHVSFSAADAELLKLLIKPLYGDRPAIAVRELVQNAVDAVRERQALGIELDQEIGSEVSVSVKKNDDGTWSLVVEDHGIGMTYDTLKNYFLNAGASFRSSMVWKKEFQTDSGESTVLRSGRFGVGALAAFLLADDPKMVTVSVSTRHALATNDDGLEFQAKLTDRPLTIRHITKALPGTRIEVTTSSAPAFMQRSSSKEDNLAGEWDWYCLDKPSVERVTASGQVLKQQITLPSSEQTSHDSYHWIKPDGYHSVGWTYDDAPALVCNGIIVSRQRGPAPSLYEAESYIGKITTKLPSLSVFDKNGRLPLTLDRLHVDFEGISFLEDLRDDVFRNIAAYLVVCAPGDLRVGVGVDTTKHKMLKSHPAIAGSMKRVPWVLTPKGVSIYEPSFFGDLGVERIIEIKESSDLSFVTSFSDINRSAVAISSHSLWIDEIPKLKERGIAEAKRGIYREKVALDESDYELLRSVFRIACDESYEYSADRPVDHESWFRRQARRAAGYLSGDLKDEHSSVSPSTFREHFGGLLNDAHRMVHPADQHDFEAAARRALAFIESHLTREGKVTMGMHKAADELREVLRDGNGHRVQGAMNRVLVFLNEGRGRSQRISPDDAAYELHREFRRLVERDGLDGDVKRMVDEIFRRLDRRVGASRGPVPNEVMHALDMLREVRPRDVRSFDVEGDTQGGVIDWDAVQQAKRTRSGWSIAEYLIDPKTTPVPTTVSTLGRIWNEYVGQTVIPYDLEARRKQLATLWAREDIKRHLAQWEAVLASSEDARR